MFLGRAGERRIWEELWNRATGDSVRAARMFGLCPASYLHVGQLPTSGNIQAPRGPRGDRVRTVWAGRSPVLAGRCLQSSRRLVERGVPFSPSPPRPAQPSPESPAETPARRSPGSGRRPQPRSCGIAQAPLEPFPFLSRGRGQPPGTASSRTRCFSPPPRGRQGPWASPLSPGLLAHPGGAAACPSPQASSGCPSTALAPQSGPNQL